jgi:DNA-binding NarL/FixJ family response regulator
MKRSSLILVDDHYLCAAGLEAILSREFEIRAVLPSAVGIVGELVRSCPDGLLLDVAMPGLNGIEAAEQIRRRQLCTPILMVTMHADPTYAIRALSAGASGYVLKTAAPDELILAIRKVLAGGTYVASPIARAVEKACEGKLDPLGGVTRRQQIVLRLAAAGWTAREIGSLLGISSRTAEFHKYRAMEVLGLKNMCDLIQFALLHRLLGPDR